MNPVAPSRKSGSGDGAEEEDGTEQVFSDGDPN